MAESQVAAVNNVEVQGLAAANQVQPGLNQNIFGALPQNALSYQAFPMLSAGLTSIANPASGAAGALSNLVKGMGGASLQMMHAQFDFWTEEENRLFVAAVESQKFPPDWAAVAARVGSKSVEQCSSYAAFYFKTLQHRVQAASAEGTPTPTHLSAQQVYAFLGVSPIYAEYLRARGFLAPGHSAAAAQWGAPAASAAAAAPASSGAGKSSIDFLCDNQAKPAQLSPAATDTTNSPGAASTDSFVSMANGSAQRHAQENKNDNVQRGREGAGAAGAAPEVGTKRWRAESPTKDKDREIDRNRINRREMWAYAAMDESAARKALEAAERGDEIDDKNPWDWTRKLIIKPNGYAQWWPHFAEFTLLSRRDVSDDLRVIKDKAPEPVERPKAADREAAAQKNRPMHEWIYVGSFVEIKWQGDWWHAKVKKVKAERGSDKLEKIFVSYVGGTEDENEWVPAIPSKVRAPREEAPDVADKKKKSGARGGRGSSR